MANNYRNQREKVTPPQVSLGALRRACGLTLDALCERYEETTGNELQRGSLSGIENGHRGASREVLAGLEDTYGLNRGDIFTTYRPRVRAA